MSILSASRTRRVFLAVSIVLVLGVVAAFAVASGISLPGSTIVRVKKISPSGDVENPTSIMVEFSSPMVPKSNVGRPESLDNAPFTITPSINAVGRWHSPSLYLVTPAAPLAMATEYMIEMKPDVTDLEGRPLKNAYIFRTMELRPIAVKAEYEKKRTIIFLEFNMPVEPGVLKNFLTVTDRQNKKNIPFSIIETAAASELHIECNLARGQDFSLDIAPGLRSTAGPLPTTKAFTSTISGIKATEAQPPDPLLVNTVYADRNTNGLSIMVLFSESAGENPPATDLHEYISVTPAVKNLSITPRYSAWYDTIEIRGDFKPQDTITVTVKKGFSINGKNKLEKDVTRSVLMLDYQASLKFAENGKYLTPSRGTTVGIEAVNVKEIQYSLLKLYENNLTVSMVNNDYMRFRVPEYLSQIVASGEVKLTAAPNEKLRRSIDLAALAGTERGVFLLTLNGVPSPAGGSSEWQLRNVNNTIILTDIGICAAARDNGIMIWANSIARGEPLSGAKVLIYSTSNQIMAQGKTDANGLFTLNLPSQWQNGLIPALVTVATDDDLSFLQLRSALQERSGYETSGRSYLKSGYEAFLFAPRGVFRPGDKVEIKAIVRDAQLKVPKGVPLQWRIITPTHREMRRGSVTLNENGTTFFDLNLPASTATGEYQVHLFVPGNEKMPIGKMSFAVEEFVPPRLEVKVNASLEGGARMLLPTGKITYEITSNYLFGAPASGLEYEGDFTVVPKTFTHPQWTNFTFEDATRNFAVIRERLAVNGKLDKNGKTQTDYTSNNWSAPSLLSVLFTARVQEHGGRWTSQTQVTDWYPAENMLGIQKNGEEYEEGKPIIINVAAVTPDGKPGSLKTAKIEFFRVDTHYTWIEQNDRSYYNSEEEFIPIKTEKATVSLKNGTGSFTVTPPRWGEYLIRVSDPKNKAAASTRIYVSSMGRTGSGQGSGLMDRVTLELDKKRYKVGDTAKLTIRAPFKGKVLLAAQTYKQLWTKTFDLTDTEKTITVPVTSDMGPNAYLIMWLLRPVTENETGGATWSAHRAIGITSIAIDPTPFGLNVLLETPERAVPGKSFDVNVTLKDPDGTPVPGEVALAFIDEGILSLTRYNTPDPIGFFFAKRMLGAELYDMYDFLMPPELRAQPLLHPGGDADGAGIESFMSTLKRNQEMLTIFLGTIKTNAQGQATAHLTLPEYSGKGRLMAVAVADTFMGSAERSVHISRDIIVETSTPRALAPGDTFILPLTVLSVQPEKTKTATVAVSAEGPIAFSGATSFEITSGSTQQNVSLTGRALNENAVATIIITTTIPGDPENSYTQRLEIPVRSPFPHISKTGSGTVPPNSNVSVTLPSGWIKGTERSILSISDGPKADLLTVLNQLAQYPYGCLEQTVSKAWPYIVFPDLVQEMDMRLANPEAVKQALTETIARLGTMQNPDGSFRMWPDQGWSTYRWGSVYATHFLLEAQKQIPVPEDLLNTALEWLQLMLAQSIDGNEYRYNSHMEYSTKAYAVFVLTLAGRTPVGWLQHLSEKQNDMYPSGRIFLATARALHAGNAKPLRTLPAVSTVTEIDSLTLDSPLRNRGLLLLAWSLVEPGSAEASNLAQELISVIKHQDEYRSTQENGYIALALGRYMNATALSRKPFNAVVTSHEGTLLIKGDNSQPMLLCDKQLPKLSPLNIATKGPGSPMFSWISSGIPVTVPPAIDNNLSLKRKITTLDGQELVPAQDGALHIKQGALLNVTLTLNPGANPLREAVLADILPGGLEVENPRFTDVAHKDTTTNPNDEETPPALRIDLRDDRVIIFCDIVTRPISHTYTLRAVTKGTFTLPPATAEGMYAPMRHSRTSHGKVIVE